MLLHVFLVLLAFHYVFLVLGIERKKGGYVLLAIFIVLILMWSAAFVIQLPVTDVSANNIIPSFFTSDARVWVKGIRDPITSFFLLLQEFLDIIIYGHLTKWGLRFRERGWF